MLKLQIETWSIDRLVPYAGSPRSNDHAVEKMVAVIRDFGFRIPLVARSDGELVDGHLRLKAAIALGYTEVPVLLSDDLTPDQVRAFRLLVNRSAMWATWDEELLTREIEALMFARFDIALTGFDQSELDKLLLSSADKGGNADALPDVPAVPVIRPGELWLLGNHRVMCGSALSSTEMARLLGGQKATMVWTDPPYNVAYTGKAGRILNDKLSEAEFEAFLFEAFTRMNEALRPGGAIYVAHSEAGGGTTFRQTFLRAGFRFASCLVWKKQQAVLSRSDYHWQHEPVLYGWKPGAAHKWYGDRKQKTVVEANLPGVTMQEDGTLQMLVDGKLYCVTGQNLRIVELPSTVMEVAKPAKSDMHPTTKPVALVSSMVSNSSPTGGSVLDPFGGSGSTVIACERLGRGCCTMELDPRYAQVIVARWQDYTGKHAVREVDGKLFDELL